MSTSMVEDSAGTRISTSGLELKLHPLVLINVSDHHTRMAANTGQPSAKVFGALLGAHSGRTLDISNTFEIKVDAGPDGAPVIDQEFLKRRKEQYKQVFPKLDTVGWYTTGDAITNADATFNAGMMALNEELNDSPLLLLLSTGVDATRKDLPVTLFETEMHVIEGRPTHVFARSEYAVETSDAERIGVDQVAKILPSGKASGSEQLTAHLVGLHSAIKMLHTRVACIQQLVRAMRDGRTPFDAARVRKISSLMHSLPAMASPMFNGGYLTDYNDTLLTVFLASMTKGVSAANDIADKFSIAYDKSGRRRGVM
uniref:COP9 signalosome complex subunit 6 n=1 Tax=Chlamydomonas euryale TaxID=1486919 RepID=A0A7R9VSN0_9CHLO|mmetsp:Transcript_43328/g.129938  ORF Transcript_43328/g.129938 Transcript_43328/m.129938 type:complete len:313 (+) Transcript_43328:304-1242(+)